MIMNCLCVLSNEELLRLPAFEGGEDFGAVFSHLVVGHAGLFAELRTFFDIFFHGTFVEKLAFVVAPFAVVFISRTIFISAEHII